MNIIMLAGGLGSRLGEETKYIPKPLVSVGNKTIIEIIIENIEKAFNANFIFCCYYKSNEIKNYLKKFNIKYKVIVEKEKLGTGGAIVNAIKKENNNNSFIALNCDTYIDIDLNDFYKKCKKSGKNFGIVLTKNNIKIMGEYNISFYNEKILLNETSECNSIDCGVYYINSCVVKNYGFGELDLRVIIDNQIRNNDIFVFLTSRSFIDIGTPERLDYARRELCNK